MFQEELTDEEAEELMNAVFQFTSETEYRTGAIRTLIFYGAIIIFVLLMLWML